MISTASQVRHALAGAEYPASPADLVGAAEQRGAGPELLSELESLTGEEYESTAEVIAELGDEDDDVEDEDEDEHDELLEL